VLYFCPVSNSARPLSSASGHIRVKPDVTNDGADHIIAKRKEQEMCDPAGCTRKPRSFYIKVSHFSQLYEFTIHYLCKGGCP
jgi:hypothetical protein